MNTKELFKTIDAMDVDSFGKFLTSNVRFVFGNQPAIVGNKQVQDVVTDFFSAIKGISHKINKEYKVDNAIIVRGTVTYTRVNDTKLTVPFCNVFELKDDLVKEYLIYVDVSGLF